MKIKNHTDLALVKQYRDDVLQLAAPHASKNALVVIEERLAKLDVLDKAETPYFRNLVKGLLSDDIRRVREPYFDLNPAYYCAVIERVEEIDGEKLPLPILKVVNPGHSKVHYMYEHELI